MKFNIATIVAAAGAFTSVLAAPSTTPDLVAVEQRDLLSLQKSNAPQLPATDALSIVKKLQKELDPIESQLMKISHEAKGKSQNEKDMQAAKQHLKAMSDAIYKAIDEVSKQAREHNKSHNSANEDSTDASSKPKASVQALANALKHTLITAAMTVNTLVASLGLTGLLSFLTPVTASLSGLVITLIPVVDGLLPVLNVILDGVVAGLSGLLAGLIL